MAYSFRNDESLADNLHAVAISQIEAAMGDLKQLPQEEAVHAVRKHCKKLRALLRLVRGEVEDLYSYENAQYRALANGLSTSRDAVSLRDALLKVSPGKYPQIQRFLEQRAVQQNDADAIEEAGALLQQGRNRIARWSLDQIRWKHARRGYRKGYRRARNAKRAVLKDSSTETMHTFRKRVKDHWYHTRLLEKRFPEIGERRKPLKELSQALGDWRDLHLLRRLLAQDAEEFSGELIPFLDCTSSRLQTLDSQIEQLCSKLFAPKQPPLSRQKT